MAAGSAAAADPSSCRSPICSLQAVQLLLAKAPEAVAGDRGLLRAWRELQGPPGEDRVQQTLTQLAQTALAWAAALFQAEAVALQARALCLCEDPRCCASLT